MNVRSFVVHLVLIAIGIGIGAVAMLTGIRASRNPEGFFYSVRVALGAPPQDTSEANWLQRTYGPDRQSMHFEEWIIRDFFRGKTKGVFVDVGSADYKAASNTWFLEDQLEWSGLAIDAQDRYRTGYEKHRPRTKFVTFFVSDRSHDNVRLFMDNQPWVASSRREFTARYGAVQGAIDVPTISLNDLLEGERLTRFDFLSMDIELAQPKALAGLDIQRFKPQLVCVEAHSEVRQQILDYFATNHYVVVGKYLRVDQDNLWFMPVGSRVEAFPPKDKPADWLRR